MIKITLIILLAFNVGFAVEMYSILQTRGEFENAEIIIDKTKCDSSFYEIYTTDIQKCRYKFDELKNKDNKSMQELEEVNDCKEMIKSIEGIINEYSSFYKKVENTKNLIYVESKKCEGNFDRLNYNEIFINDLELEPGEYDVTYEIKANQYNCEVEEKYPLKCYGAEDFRVIKVNERVFKDKYIVNKKSSRHIIGFGEKINKFFVQPNEIDGSFKIILKNREGVKLAEEEFKVPLLETTQAE
tara:strand:+ start:43809 stop:44537 length:729 start_codon:yes stop_codon:yes gene_type:complete